MSQQKIKNIIFDLGNVVININPLLTAEAIQKLGYFKFNFSELSTEDQTLLHQFETGEITAKKFRIYIRRKTKENHADNTIDEAWNALLLDIPKERLRLLKKLKTKYRLFLLSNTNEIHLNKVLSYLKETHGIQNLSGYFEKEYYSHQINFRKPHTEIYSHVLTENNLIAEETLFIDDNEENIYGAKKLNIKTYHLNPAIESILDITI